MTKDYVDREAQLRNLRAQEAQYLGILKQAKTVKDTLQVSDKLNDVRSEIEQQQAEFEALSKQVEMVALSVSVRAEADVQAFGLRWAQRRAATAPSASCSRVVPNSCRWRLAASDYAVTGFIGR